MNKRLVHIIDDEAPVRRSASFLLKLEGFAVETFESGTAFLKVVDRLEQGCILLDVRMPEMDGLQVQRELADRGVTMPVVVLTGHGDISIAVRAMKAGAVDFLEKPFEKPSLMRAIEAGFERLTRIAAGSVQAQEAQLLIASLSSRELDVLKGLVKGFPNKTIAYDLGISPRTVEAHRANMMTKLEVRSLSDALRIAFAAGLGKGEA